MQPEKPQPKISAPEAYLLLAFAVILDLISIIPLINELTAVVATAGYQLYYFLKGVRGYAGLATNIIEFFPALSALPGITAGVGIVILIDRATATKLGQTALKATGPAQKFVTLKGGGAPSGAASAPALKKAA
jgi:hypothetical protein